MRKNTTTLEGKSSINKCKKCHKVPNVKDKHSFEKKKQK